MVKISNIYGFLKEKAPLELCESWDNSGMLINTNSETNKVLLTLDVTDEVINEAIEKGCQLIISHHPIIFKPLKTLSSNDIVFKLIQNNISVISMHTNLDATENGVNDVLAQILGLKNIEVFANIGRKGEVEVTSVKDFADKVAKILNTKLKYTLPEKEIKSIAVIGGSAGGYWKNALIEGVDLFLTGEASHHDALEAIHENMPIIIAGHWNTEVIILESLKKELETKFSNIAFIISSQKDPFEYI